MCRQRQTIFTPKSDVELELAEEEEEEEEEEEKEEGNYGKESFGRVMQLISCGKYEEVVLLAYCLWEKREKKGNPEERENDVRESAIQLVKKMSEEGAAVALQILEPALAVRGNSKPQDTC